MKLVLTSWLTAALLAVSGAASAQYPDRYPDQYPKRYPDRPIQWIVPYPAGGGSDAIARVVTQAMQARLGQPLVIDNRPGASTNIAVAALLQARPDGYTVMQAQEAALAPTCTCSASCRTTRVATSRPSARSRACRWRWS